VTGTLLNAASRLTHGVAGTFDIAMPLTGTSGVENRSSSTYNAVFTFDGAVTSGEVMVVSGAATVGTISFSGNSMTAQLTGVTSAEVVTLRVENINGDGQQHGDVPFGFLAADVNGNRIVDKPDQQQIRTDKGQVVTAVNFRDDINLSGVVDNPDVQSVKTNEYRSRNSVLAMNGALGELDIDGKPRGEQGARNQISVSHAEQGFAPSGAHPGSTLLPGCQ
jgi:hypothetical protein